MATKDERSDKLQVDVRLENFVGTANGVWTAYQETVKALTTAEKVELLDSSQNSPDIIHFHSIGPGYIWTALRNPSMTAVTAHVVPESFVGSIIGGNWWKPLGTKYLRYTYNLADLVLAVSPFVQKTLQDIGVKSPIKVLPNCVDRDKFYPYENNDKNKLREALDLDQNSKIVMTVGQLQPRKGLDDFLKVAKRLPSIDFVWVGGLLYGILSAERRRMDRIMKGSPDNVHFPGVIPYDEIPDYYNEADLFFLPSYQENFPFVILEAASCGLPVMLRDIPEYQAILDDNYLKGKSIQEFTENIKSIFKNSNEYKSYRQRSLSVAEEYDTSAYLQNLINYYDQFLQ